MPPVYLKPDDDFVMCPVCGQVTDPVGSHNYCPFCGYIVPCCEPDQTCANPDKDEERDNAK